MASYQQSRHYLSMPPWKRFLLDNPELFLQRYFHHRLYELKPFHLELIESVLSRTRSLQLYPATHGKTTLVSTLLPILALCRDPDVRIAIIGKNDAEGTAIMGVIQAELTNNDDLIRDFGPFKPPTSKGKYATDDKPWSNLKIQVQQRRRRAKESTIAVFGAGSRQVLGYRTDWTICDDVVTEQNSASPTQRERLKDWFDLCVETGPENVDSALTVVGTRFDPHDLYGDLKEAFDGEEKIWHVEEYDAIVSTEKRETLWPERWPWARLMQQKIKVGTLSFNKRYRNIAVDSSRIAVKEAYVFGGWDNTRQYPGCLDRHHSIGDFHERWRLVSGFDPAIGMTKKAKFCAHMTLAMGACGEHERCFWVIDLLRKQMTQPQQVETILERHKRYRLARSVIEANAYQMGLYEAVEQKMDEQGHAWVLVPHFTSRTNKPDPEFGVGAMSPWFEQGKVHIPWATNHDQRVMRDFVDELVMYPSGRTTDTVMAFWFAWRDLMESAPVMDSYNRLDRLRPKRPWMGRSGRYVLNPAYLRDTEEVPA